ncbi:MAG: hypothetical protein B7Z55_03290 [Planctomycetales bacterium 12-60-4]|nr:MAG: hypothetical protein B7Z55_03290 [Planctomycetales bacterium 12-60-4]
MALSPLSSAGMKSTHSEQLVDEEPGNGCLGSFRMVSDSMWNGTSLLNHQHNESLVGNAWYSESLANIITHVGSSFVATFFQRIVSAMDRDPGHGILPTPNRATWLTDGVALHRGTRPPGDGCGRHTHDYHSLTVLLSSPGSSNWCYGDRNCRSIRPSAGDVFFCPAHVTTTVRCEKEYESILLCLSPAVFNRIADQLDDAPTASMAPAIMRRDTFIHQIVGSLAEEVDRKHQIGAPLMSNSLATALSIHLMREYVGTCHIPQTVSRLSGIELDRLYQYIELNIDSPLTVTDLASFVGKSPYHFSRLFKASTGTSPHKYVISRRVERARELLRAGRGIVDVALATGFSSQSHLSHHIRRAFGCTPGELISRQ